MANLSSRLERLVADAVGLYTGLGALGGEPADAASLGELVTAATLYVRSERGGTAIAVFPEPDKNPNVLAARIAAHTRELAVDADLWGYCCVHLVRFSLQNGERPWGLMVHAGEKGEFHGLLRLHPLQVDDAETVVAVLPAVVEQAPPSWLVSADS